MCLCALSAPFGSPRECYARPRTLAILTPGKKKDKWEERVFTLTKKGLSWCAALRCSPRWNRLARYQHFAQTVVSQCKRRGTTPVIVRVRCERRAGKQAAGAGASPRRQSITCKQMETVKQVEVASSQFTVRYCDWHTCISLPLAGRDSPGKPTLLLQYTRRA